MLNFHEFEGGIEVFPFNNYFPFPPAFNSQLPKFNWSFAWILLNSIILGDYNFVYDSWNIFSVLYLKIAKGYIIREI